MKHFIVIVLMAFFLASCEKQELVQPEPDQAVVSNPQPKITPHMKIMRRNTSLRATVSVIFVSNQDSTAWLCYELPKVNSAFNPHAPNVRLPEGFYGFGRTPGGMVVDGWSAGNCFYTGGNSWVQIVPRGGIVFQFQCWKKNATQTLYGAAAAQALYDRLPDTGVVQFY